MFWGENTHITSVMHCFVLIMLDCLEKKCYSKTNSLNVSFQIYFIYCYSFKISSQHQGMFFWLHTRSSCSYKHVENVESALKQMNVSLSCMRTSILHATWQKGAGAGHKSHDISHNSQSVFVCVCVCNYMNVVRHDDL